MEYGPDDKEKEEMEPEVKEIPAPAATPPVAAPASAPPPVPAPAAAPPVTKPTAKPAKPTKKALVKKGAKKAAPKKAAKKAPAKKAVLKKVAKNAPPKKATPKKGNSGSRKAREYTKGARVVASSKCYDYRKPSHIMIRYWIEVTDLDTGKLLNNSVCLSRKEAEDERQRLKDEGVTQQHRYGVRIRLEFVEVKTKTATLD